MDKPLLQRRAEALATEFRSSGRPALVIEFAGLPKAGKTTTLNQAYSFLRRCGFRCEVVVERASVCPIRDKKHFNFNIWTACTSLSHLLDKTQNPPRQDDPDTLFLDRGIFDSLCWFSVLEKLSRITAEDRIIRSRLNRSMFWAFGLSQASKVFGLSMAKPTRSLLMRAKGKDYLTSTFVFLRAASMNYTALTTQTIPSP